MSTPKPLSPAETMRAILDEAGKDAVEEVMALAPEAVNDALKAAGVDPAEAERRATAAIEAALAKFGEAAEPVKSNVVPLAGRPAASRPAARAAARRWAVWAPVAAAAAAAVTLGVMNGSAIVALFRGTEPIGPDRYGNPPSTVATSTEPTPTQRALALRTQAFAACKEAQWDPCLAWLDEAAQLDPAGDATPEVIAARAAAKKGEADDARKLKPRAP